MLSRLKDKHRGEVVAIVGSGPYAGLYDGQYRVSIGINGAALLGYRFSYFLCGDRLSYKRDWFDIDCSDVRIIAALVASKDNRLYPHERFHFLERMSVHAHEQNCVRYLPYPVPPHLRFWYGAYNITKLSKDMDFLMPGGTIACCAVQLAYIMGASSIHLFGCQFTHEYGHYFYESDYDGMVSISQRTVMDDTLRELRDRGISVVVYGPTNLKEFDKQCLLSQSSSRL